ncbi:MAG: HAMP domain-containing sensor histidine kinase [Anaerolineaceae bacterium]|nr:HAMP domain-containing sensor histidine kinase [Anaerolineaceae bacterium]
MFKSLSIKLTIAFMLVAAITAALVAFSIRITNEDRLTRLIVDQQQSSMEQALSDYYLSQGSWENIAAAWSQIQQEASVPGQSFLEDKPYVDAPPPNNGQDLFPANDNQNRSLFGLADAQGRVVVSIDPHYAAGDQLPAFVLDSGTAVTVNETQVGTLLTPQRLPRYNPEEQRFLERTNQALIVGMLGALLAALIIGLLLARTLTQPLRALTTATQAIAQGHLEQQVAVHSKDEIGQLAEAFNSMSLEVARSNQLRRQMTADIAHDLRTPLTVIAGYVESMRDGVLHPTMQRLALIFSEIERLQKMVEDLRTLSKADAGELSLHPQAVSPQALLDWAAELFQHHAGRQNVTIQVDIPEGLPDIYVDEARMMQVLDNLVSNALRYTNTGGVISLSARSVGGKVELTVADNGVGIPVDEMPFIFDRFHRGDKSRQTDTGSSGLGLAIVKALVESQGGKVWAESRLEQGTAIHMAMALAGS